MRARSALFVLAILTIASSTASGQSLGDLAKRQAERRKNAKDDGKVLTNKDVRNPQIAPDPVPAAAADSIAPDGQPKTPADATKADGSKAEPAAQADPSSKPEASETKDETYWRARVKAVHDQLNRDQVLLDALQSRINALTTDFVNRDDPAQRGQISADRQKALDELAKTTDRITADKKAITDLEDEARRANVPAGWLR
ncbi:MAG TPA: hypothetical protein VJP86_04060 [Vicinamibacterales bacterium]|nr:hypothetical protein [Vicinamibacterales bacterium]